MGARVLQEHCGYNFIPRQQTVPLRQVGRGAKRRRGWIKPATTYYLSTPSPLRGTHPCLRGRKWMLGYCRNIMNIFIPRQQTVPLRQGGRGAKRRRGWIRKLAAHYYLDYLSTPSPLRGTHPCLRGRKWMLGYFIIYSSVTSRKHYKEQKQSPHTISIPS